ncbi:hypothetical protein L0337_09875 [candidate division KSB1 bacterium]|nr:hypothetical protein [candidate division KSB1 bacterium]
MSSKKYPEPKPRSSRPSKVSESVAGYAVSPAAAKRKSLAKSRRIAGLEASDEVWEFAQKHRLVPHLETAVRLAKASFNDIKKIYLTFEPDPEIPSLHGIAINANIGGTLEDREYQYQIFDQRFAQEVPREFHLKICLLLRSA